MNSSPPIRVGFVMHKMQVAGAEVLVKQIIERLKGAIDATVFCLDGIGKLGHQLIDGGTPVVDLKRKPGLDLKVAGRLAAEIKAREIEVLHAHQYTPFFYSALSRIRHRARAKIIFTEHGRHYPDIVSWKRRLANRFLLQRYAEVTTACCDFSTVALQQTEGFASAFTLRNGVDLDCLPARNGVDEQVELRQKLGLDSGTPYAACVARFHPVKDHATLIRAWAHVNRSLPNAKLLLVGGGPEQRNLELQIQSLAVGQPQLSASIDFLGIRHDVAEILRAIDVFTLTSVSEAASLTLLEAMASGCACVVTDVGGNAEHLREGVDGFLVPRGNHEQLGDQLLELLSSRSLRDRFGNSARKQVAERFSLDNTVDDYLLHFKKLAGRTDFVEGINKRPFGNSSDSLTHSDSRRNSNRQSPEQDLCAGAQETGSRHSLPNRSPQSPANIVKTSAHN